MVTGIAFSETGGMPQRKRKRVTDDRRPDADRRRRTTGRQANRARRWTDEDDAFFLGRCEAMTDTQIAEALGRSRVGVLIRRLKVLGLQKAAPLSPWTVEDDAMLQALYGRVDTPFLAAMLFRPEEALWSRAFYLRLRTREAWSPEEDALLRKYYPCVPVPEFARLLPGRTDRNIYHRAGVLGLERGGAYFLRSWRQRFHAYPPELRSLIRLHNQVQRKLQDVEAQH